MFDWLRTVFDFQKSTKKELDKNEREKIAVLNKIKLFENASRNDLVELIKHTQFREMEAEERIVKKGETADSFYMVDSGGVEVRLEPDREPITRLVEGDYFGEMALLENKDRSAYVDCSEPGRLLKLSKDGFYSMLGNRPQTAVKFLFTLARTISRNLRETNEKLRSETSEESP